MPYHIKLVNQLIFLSVMSFMCQHAVVKRPTVAVAEWRFYIIKFWTPRWSKFFQFHAVFGKFWQNRMLAPPHWVGAPTSGKSWIRQGLFFSFSLIYSVTQLQHPLWILIMKCYKRITLFSFWGFSEDIFDSRFSYRYKYVSLTSMSLIGQLFVLTHWKTKSNFRDQHKNDKLVQLWPLEGIQVSKRSMTCMLKLNY